MIRLLTAATAALILSGCGAAVPSLPVATTAKPIDYGAEGVTLQRASDVDKLVGAPADFKKFIASVVTKATAGSNPSDQCAPTVAVDRIDPAGFASGGISDCGGAAIIWARKNGTWNQLWGGQMQPGCAEMEAAGVPKAIESVAGTGCFDKASNAVVAYVP